MVDNSGVVMSEDFEHEHKIKAEKKNDKPIEMFETIYIDVDIDPNRINKNKKVAFSDLLEDVIFIKKKKKGYLSNPFKKVQKLMTRSSSLGSVYDIKHITCDESKLKSFIFMIMKEIFKSKDL